MGKADETWTQTILRKADYCSINREILSHFKKIIADISATYAKKIKDTKIFCTFAPEKGKPMPQVGTN